MFAILLGGVARRRERLVALALHLRNEAQHRVVAEYVVVAARAEKNYAWARRRRRKNQNIIFVAVIAVWCVGENQSQFLQKRSSASQPFSGCCWGKTQERLTQSVGFDLKRERLDRGGISYVNMSSMDKGLERLTSLEKVWPFD